MCYIKTSLIDTNQLVMDRKTAIIQRLVDGNIISFEEGLILMDIPTTPKITLREAIDDGENKWAEKLGPGDVII